MTGARPPVALHRIARLAEARDLLAKLRDWPVDEPLALDAAAVDEVSTPYLAVLVSALEARAGLEPPAVLTAPTPALIDAFADLGLFSHLMRMEHRR